MIQVTEIAAKKVKDIFKEMGKPDAALRIKIVGGGCSGMQYDLGPEEKKSENDQVYETQGVVLYIDPESDTFLTDSILDYVDSLKGSGFKVINPNAKTSCGCGDSFSV